LNTSQADRRSGSFLNYPGDGEIIVGVADDGSLVGVPNADSEQLKIVDRIKNNIRPTTLGLFDVIHEKRDSKDIIRVIVSSGQQRPYYPSLRRHDRARLLYSHWQFFATDDGADD
jgi:predicted HTH transcriptional regulator